MAKTIQEQIAEMEARCKCQYKNVAFLSYVNVKLFLQYFHSIFTAF